MSMFERTLVYTPSKKILNEKIVFNAIRFDSYV